MKITIDTKHDSKEEIKRIVDFLNLLVENERAVSSQSGFGTGGFTDFGSYGSSGKEGSDASSGSGSSAPVDAFASMFGDSSGSVQSKDNAANVKARRDTSEDYIATAIDLDEDYPSVQPRDEAGDETVDDRADPEVDEEVSEDIPKTIIVDDSYSIETKHDKVVKKFDINKLLKK